MPVRHTILALTALLPLVLSTVYRTFTPGLESDATEIPYATCLAVASTSGELLVGTSRGVINVFDRDCVLSRRVRGGSSPIQHVVASTSGNCVGVLHATGECALYDTRSGALLFRVPHPVLKTLAVSPSGRYIACQDLDGTLEVWSGTTGTLLRNCGKYGDRHFLLQFSPDEQSVAVGRTGGIDLWRLQPESAPLKFDAPLGSAAVIHLLPASNALIVYDRSQAAARWNLNDGALTETLPPQGRRPALQCLNSSANVHFAAGREGHLALRRVTALDGTPTLNFPTVTLQTLGSKVVSLALSSDDRRLYSLDSDGIIRTWDSRAGFASTQWWDALQRRERVFYRAILLSYSWLLVACCLAAFRHANAGIFIAMAMTLYRDPLRKMTPDAPVIITVATSIVWVALIVGLLWHERSAAKLLFSNNSRLRLSLSLFTLAVLPAAIQSFYRYESGALLAFFGAASYAIPFAALFAGMLMECNNETEARFVNAFCVLNGCACLTALLEVTRCDLPFLGSLNYSWVRNFAYFQDGSNIEINLVSALYRSPDILAWHAAASISLAPILYRNRNSRTWAYLVVIAALPAIVLAGRRKAILLPMTVGAYLLVLGLRETFHWTQRPKLRSWWVLASTLLAATAFAVLLAPIANEHIAYFGTVSRDAASRSFSMIYSACSSVETWGVWGAGLGTVTQGRRYIGDGIPHTWQEDGLGRTVTELGVPGTVLIAISAILVIRSSSNTRSVTIPSRDLKHCISWFTFGNLLVFLVSHQVYSSDPTLTALIGFFTGLGLRSRLRQADAILPTAG